MHGGMLSGYVNCKCKMIKPTRTIHGLCCQPRYPAISTRAWSSDVNSKGPDLYSSKVLLSESNRTLTQKRLSKRTVLNEARKAKSSSLRAAAVLVPLCVDQEGQVCLLYELRAKGLSSHAGQVCFPGGIRDKLDGHDDRLETAAEAAIRETKEELGLDGAGIKLWGEMAPVGTRAGETNVVPVLGEIVRPRPLCPVNDFHLATSEVAEAFLVPIKQLAAAGKYTQFRVSNSPGYSLPVYDVSPHRIWGLTAIITFIFLRAFLPSAQYNHKINYQSPWTSS